MNVKMCLESLRRRHVKKIPELVRRERGEALRSSASSCATRGAGGSATREGRELRERRRRGPREDDGIAVVQVERRRREKPEPRGAARLQNQRSFCTLSTGYKRYVRSNIRHVQRRLKKWCIH